jgi:hypothetical protein
MLLTWQAAKPKHYPNLNIQRSCRLIKVVKAKAKDQEPPGKLMAK